MAAGSEERCIRSSGPAALRSQERMSSMSNSASRLAAALGLALLLSGCSQGDPSPAPTAAPASASSATAASSSSTTATASASPTSTASATVLPESLPLGVRIPTIGTDSELLHLGLQANGSLEVPPTGPGSPAAWYDKSPTPGELGPAILLGHVNENDGSDGVFAGLRDLQPGDEIEIPRQDGTTAVFAVDRGEAYSKDDFATDKVYGDTDDAQLRLITCDGYDPATGLWDDNYVVYATLVG